MRRVDWTVGPSAPDSFELEVYTRDEAWFLLVFWLDNYFFAASDNVSSLHSGNQRCKSRCWVCGRCPLLREWFCCTLAMIDSICFRQLIDAFYNFIHTEKVKRSTCRNVPEIDQPIARAWSTGFQGRRPNTWGTVESELGDKVSWYGRTAIHTHS